MKISRGTNAAWLVYDGMHCVAEVDTNGVLQRTYTYGPGVDNILSMTVHGAVTSRYYYLKDQQGSVLALTDEEGAVAEQYRYDAWGRVSVYDGAGRPLSESAVGNRYLWQGREYSWVTGLYYFRARWYDPITGRWLSKDPIGLAGGMNLYVFCHNDPVNCIDPMGTGGESASTMDYPFTWTPSTGLASTQPPPVLPGQPGSFITPDIYYDGTNNKFRPGLGGNSGANTWQGGGGYFGGNLISAAIGTNPPETTFPLPNVEGNDE